MEPGRRTPATAAVITCPRGTCDEIFPDSCATVDDYRARAACEGDDPFLTLTECANGVFELTEVRTETAAYWWWDSSGLPVAYEGVALGYWACTKGIVPDCPEPIQPIDYCPCDSSTSSTTP